MSKGSWVVQLDMVGVYTTCWQREYGDGFVGTVWDDGPGLWRSRLNHDGFTVFYETYDSSVVAIARCDIQQSAKLRSTLCECGKDKHGFTAHSPWCNKQGTA